VVGLGAALTILDRFPVAADRGPDEAAVRVMRMVSPQVVEGIPAMDASLSVWKAGLGASGVSYELTGGSR
jgi:hypothetical protein